MKHCNKCDTDKDDSEFYTRIVQGKVKEDKWCKECHRAYRKEHYKQNKRVYIAKARRNNDKSSDWYRDYKSQLKCKCGEDHPAALDFHHPDPTRKEFLVSKAVRRFGRKRLKEEIEKCEVLCANCHRKHHWNESL